MRCLQCVIVFLLISTVNADDSKTDTRTRSATVTSTTSTTTSTTTPTTTPTTTTTTPTPTTNTTNTTITTTTTPPVDYRLPPHVRPKRYEVELKPHIYGNDSSAFFFEGSATIRVECVNVTDNITIHTNSLNISDSNISVKQENSMKELFESSSNVTASHFLHLQLTEELEVGKVYLIEFRHFSAPMSTDNMGLYYSYYQDGNETVYLVSSLMSPVYARKVFPCFDEPHLKATFDVTLVRRKDTGRNYFSLSNAPLASSTDVRDEDGVWWTKDRFERSPTMSTYLVAFTICDFSYLENTTASDPSVTYRTYARPNAIQWAKRAHQYGLQMFDWLNDHFRPNYSHALSKLDNIMVPDFNYAGMENWGLTTFMERVLYQPGVTPAEEEMWSAFVISHETAHTWFGNYVSPLWWNWLWTKEAICSLLEIYVPQEIFPDWKVKDNWVSKYLYGVMEFDALPTSHPLTIDVQTPAEIGASIDDIPYYKGSQVMQMIQFAMGVDTFIEGLNLYLERNLYGNADTASLFSALDEKMEAHDFGPRYISSKMEPWFSQTGYPVVMVTRTAEGYILTQTRFLIGAENYTDDGSQWEIPVVYATSANTSMTKSRGDIRWLSKNHSLFIPDSSASDANGWILINVQQMGYYRVHYDNATWRALVGQLNRDHSVIPAINRAQLINDAWNLVTANMLSMSETLRILDFLQSETELAPWRAFSREIHHMELMLERTHVYPLLRTRIQDMLRAPLQHLTLNINNNMIPSDVAVRTLLAEYAVRYGLGEHVAEAKRLFKVWKTTGTNGINVNLRFWFYCAAVADGDVTDWEFVYTQFKSNDDSSELSNLRHGLSCTTNETLLRRLLDMTLNPMEIRKQDIYTTIKYVASNPLSRPNMTFEFFENNYDYFRNNVDAWHRDRVLEYATEHFNTKDEVQKLKEFRADPDDKKIRSKIIAQTESNIAWLSHKLGAFEKWLKSGDPSSTPVSSSSSSTPVARSYSGKF